MSFTESDKNEILAHAEAIVKIVKEKRESSSEEKRDPLAWRDDPATEKQKRVLMKNKFSFSEGITKGEASDHIDKILKASKED